MARQKLGQKKVNKLRQQTGLDILVVLVRGGTNHRRDLCLSDGSVVNLYKDGTMEKDTIGWNMKNYKQNKK